MCYIHKLALSTIPRVTICLVTVQSYSHVTGSSRTVTPQPASISHTKMQKHVITYCAEAEIMKHFVKGSNEVESLHSPPHGNLKSLIHIYPGSN